MPKAGAFKKLCGFANVFRLKKPHGKKIIEIGIPMDDFDDIKILQGWDEYISDYLFEPGMIATYEYDFGDSWNHEIVLEGILLKDKTSKYPRCIDGQRACPPEDCGGVWGYENLLKVIADPDNDEYKSTIEWLNGWYGKYDPEAFNRKKIKFDNSKKRWKKAFLKH